MSLDRTQVHCSLFEIETAANLPPNGLACTDAYLTPCLRRYIETFSSAFEKKKLDQLNVLFMQSDGGLTPVEK